MKKAKVVKILLNLLEANLLEDLLFWGSFILLLYAANMLDKPYGIAIQGVLLLIYSYLIRHNNAKERGEGGD